MVDSVTEACWACGGWCREPRGEAATRPRRHEDDYECIRSLGERITELEAAIKAMKEAIG